MEKQNLTDALSNISGISKKSIRDIALAVTENNKLLNACKLHYFSIKIGEGLRTKYECSNCGGVVDGVRKKYYDLGMSHSENYNDNFECKTFAKCRLGVRCSTSCKDYKPEI